MLPVIVIPAYEPEAGLIEIVDQLLKINANQQFIIIDDGSLSEAAQKIFETLSFYPNIILLKHTHNKGKGSALKTAFAYYLEHFRDNIGVVTADADGQHLSKDIAGVSEALQNTRQLVLGVRAFDPSVPWRSRFGNELTRKIFGWFSGKSIQDTQTGLRGLSRDIIPQLLKIENNDYAYEMNMLMLGVKEGWDVKEVPISTVYIEQNRSSHFNPLKDSLKIYFVFIRYSVLSLISAGIDFLLFFLFFHFSKSIPFSTATARILSGIFNFTFCKSLIFKSERKAFWEAFQYICLAVSSIILSSLLVSFFFYMVKFNIVASKILSDSMIFLFNFGIQRFFIFRLSLRLK